MFKAKRILLTIYITRQQSVRACLSTMNCNSRGLFSHLLVFPVFRFAPLDFFGRFDGFYNRTNQGLDTWFCQLIDGCACVPVFSHRVAHAPFKLHVTAVWVWHGRNLQKKTRDKTILSTTVIDFQLLFNLF